MRFPIRAARLSGALLAGWLTGATRLSAQAVRPDPVGVWRGTSLCQVKPSACHDETVVFRISATTTADRVALDGRKVVGGEEVEMGILGCRFDRSGAALTCPMPNGTWRFVIRGDSLVGELRDVGRRQDP